LGGKGGGRDGLGIPRGESCVGEGVVELGVEFGRVYNVGGELATNYSASQSVEYSFDRVY
jgi:hypothetical protein